MKCDSRTCPYRDTIQLLRSIVLEGKPVPDPSIDEAVEAAMRGDWGPFMRINEKMEGGEARHAVTDIPETTNTGTTAL